jgi:hypothetical protein
MKNFMRLLIVVFIMAIAFSAKAQDRFLAYTAQSNVLPKGTREIEIWYANKNGGYAFFNGNYMRTGFKMGFGKNFLAGYYLNYQSEAFIFSEIDHGDHKTRLFDQNLTVENDISFSLYTKYKLLDPVANPVGLAIEAELQLGSNYINYIPKIILDKRFGQNYLALNVWAAIHRERQIEKTTDAPSTKAPQITNFVEPPIELDLAYLRFTKNNNIGFGFEARAHAEKTDFAGWEHVALFAGPAFHVRGDKWFFNFSAMPQIANFHKSWLAPDNLVLDEHQRFELRTMLGFMF